MHFQCKNKKITLIIITMKKLSQKLFLIIIIFLVNPVNIYAQNEIDPPPEAPIDDYNVAMLICAILLGGLTVCSRIIKTEKK